MADYDEKWNGEDQGSRVPTPLHWESLFDEDDDDIFYDAIDYWPNETKTDEVRKIVPLEQTDLKYDDNNNVITELLDLIECVICFDNPREPTHIYQCQNGHLFCEDCLEKMKNCSVCQKPLNKDSRNLMVEKILSILNKYTEPINGSTIAKSLPKPNSNRKKSIIEPMNLINEKDRSEIENQEWCTVLRKKNKFKKIPSVEVPKEPVVDQILSGWKERIQRAQNLLQQAESEDYFATNGKEKTKKIITIPNSFAGFILSNGWKSEIEYDSKAFLFISAEDPEGSNERSLHISGTPEQIQRAQYLLQYPKRYGDEETIHLEISSRIVGAIIGVGGSKIQHVEFKSKAKIYLSYPFQGSQKRVLTISGTREHRDYETETWTQCRTGAENVNIRQNNQKKKILKIKIL